MRAPPGGGYSEPLELKRSDFCAEATRAGEQKYGHREIQSCIEAIRLSSIAIFMFVFTFDLLCDIMMVNIRNEVFI